MAPVIGGVDTHSDTHCAAVIDHLGRLCGTSQFPTTKVGLAALRNWMPSFGELTAVGVEGTGTYGAELARFLHSESIEVREVPRPSRRLRRQRGKSDPLDAEAAARAVLGGQAKVLPKFGCDRIEAIYAFINVPLDGAAICILYDHCFSSATAFPHPKYWVTSVLLTGPRPKCCFFDSCLLTSLPPRKVSSASMCPTMARVSTRDLLNDSISALKWPAALRLAERGFVIVRAGSFQATVDDIRLRYDSFTPRHSWRGALKGRGASGRQCYPQMHDSLLAKYA